jgi:hypothetical protein
MLFKPIQCRILSVLTILFVRFASLLTFNWPSSLCSRGDIYCNFFSQVHESNNSTFLGSHARYGGIILAPPSGPSLLIPRGLKHEALVNIQGSPAEPDTQLASLYEVS